MKKRDLIKKHLTPFRVMRTNDYFLQAHRDEPEPALDTIATILQQAGVPRLSQDDADRLRAKIDIVFRRQCMESGFKAGVDYVLDFLGYTPIFEKLEEVEGF